MTDGGAGYFARIAGVALLFSSAACSSSKSKPASGSPAPPEKSAPPVATASVPRAEASAGLPAPTGWMVPSGPRLAILAGQGVGPIRFGATVATIERLMAMPCEFRTENSCRYVARAIEFTLKDGVTVQMHLHRKDRPTTPEGSFFGVFNGRTPEGVAFFMLPSGVEEIMGRPRKIEPVKDPNPWGMVEVYDYPGMQLEFDRLPNGNVVLGGIVITADKKN